MSEDVYDGISEERRELKGAEGSWKFEGRETGCWGELLGVVDENGGAPC